jgi:hypothetical protein
MNAIETMALLVEKRRLWRVESRTTGADAPPSARSRFLQAREAPISPNAFKHFRKSLFFNDFYLWAV